MPDKPPNTLLILGSDYPRTPPLCILVLTLPPGSSLSPASKFLSSEADSFSQAFSQVPGSVWSGNLISLSVPSSPGPGSAHSCPNTSKSGLRFYPKVLSHLHRSRLSWRSDSTPGCPGSNPQTLAPPSRHWFHPWAAQAPLQDFGSTPRALRLRPRLSKFLTRKAQPFLPEPAAGACAGQSGSG